MPYVDAQTKAKLARHGGWPETPGELTYMITRSLQEYLHTKLMKHRQDGDNRIRYADVAEALGALEGAKADLVRRILTPLEERAQDTNDDVWMPDLLEAAGSVSAEHVARDLIDGLFGAIFTDPDVEAVYSPETDQNLCDSARADGAGGSD